jgi:transposase
VVKATYAKKGQTPILSVSDSKGYQHLSLCGFISERGELKYQIRQGSFKGQAICRFLEREFGGRHQQKYSLIWDGASIHRGQAVKNFLQADEKRQRVWLYRIPPYCPQLNPVELLWSYLKGVRLANVVCKTLKELRQKVIEAMEEIKKDRELLKSFFRCKEVGFMQY